MDGGLTQAIINMSAVLGYAGLAVGLILDSAGLPIPSEALLPLAGVLVKQGEFNFTEADSRKCRFAEFSGLYRSSDTWYGW